MSSSVLLLKCLPTGRGWKSRTSFSPCCTHPTKERAVSGNVCKLSPSKNHSNDHRTTTDPPSLHRKLIWFHHIKSSQKKKHILEWGKELRLGGYSKPGFPGILIFEGKAENVADYLKRIKRLRWQHLQVRGEEEEHLSPEHDPQDLDSLRRFPIEIRELPESGMSELAEKCREAKLEQLFLTAFKISR